MPDNPEDKKISRRDILKQGVWYAGLLAISGGLGLIAAHAEQRTVWQIDPQKCIACGRCGTECVLGTSAVKCVHAFAMCGYCKLCTGFFEPEPNALNTGAENQLCPTGAIKRTFVEDPYYEYTIDEKLCIGCGMCVRGCGAFGNGSLFLQVRHDRCVNCNECSIATACPAQAYVRVPADKPYIIKTQDRKSQ
jgi:electron transport complex protein RnfB